MIETFLVVTESGDILITVSGEHAYPYPFNRAVAAAQSIATSSQANVLFIDDDLGKRWGRLERISDWFWSYCPTGVKP